MVKLIALMLIKLVHEAAWITVRAIHHLFLLNLLRLLHRRINSSFPGVFI